MWWGLTWVVESRRVLSIGAWGIEGDAVVAELVVVVGGVDDEEGAPVVAAATVAVAVVVLGGGGAGSAGTTIVYNQKANHVSSGWKL